MSKVYVQSRSRFSASHRLHESEKSDQFNRDTFGKCNNPKGHGHNYELWITLYGEINRENGMVFNVTRLKEIVHEEIISQVDHQFLNDDVPFLLGINPTSENLVVKFWEILKEKLPRGLLHEVKLIETENNHFIYRGEA